MVSTESVRMRPPQAEEHIDTHLCHTLLISTDSPEQLFEE